MRRRQWAQAAPEAGDCSSSPVVAAVPRSRRAGGPPGAGGQSGSCDGFVSSDGTSVLRHEPPYASFKSRRHPDRPVPNSPRRRPARGRVLFKLTVQSLPVEPQPLGGPGFVAALGFQHPLDVLPLQLLQRQPLHQRRGESILALALAQGRRQVLGRHDVAFGQRHRPFHHVFQLAHVARPGVSQQQLLGRLLEAAQRLARPFGRPGQEVLGQRQDVLGPVAQRRQVDVDDVQPVEQVLPEPPFLQPFFQMSVGGGDQANVHPFRLGGPQRADLPFLQHAQQLGLQGERQLSDLVEEDGAAVGLDEQAGLVGAWRR